MKRSTNRILTTHTGSIARPVELLEIMKARMDGKTGLEEDFEKTLHKAVVDVVQQQAAVGLDVITDGELARYDFNGYIDERLSGFEADEQSVAPVQGTPGARGWNAQEAAAFPEFYAEYYRGPYYTDSMQPVTPPSLICTGPISYIGKEALARDIANLKAGLQGLQPEEVFVTAAGLVTHRNNYYKTEEEYTQAIADAMREEYSAILDEGFMLQIDAISITRPRGVKSEEEGRRQVQKNIEALNYAIRDFDPQMIRYHTCYGPAAISKIFNPNLKDFVHHMLAINAGYYSFEACNPRHYHEYHVWEDVKLPEGKVLIPGMVSQSNIVEHPEFIAELTINYANLVGRENVIVGNDCGFSSRALNHNSLEVHPTIGWAKFKAMVEGARLATQRLWLNS